MREVVNSLMYILSTGCQWRANLEKPVAAPTLYDYFDLRSWSYETKREGGLSRQFFAAPPCIG